MHTSQPGLISPFFSREDFSRRIDTILSLYPRDEVRFVKISPAPMKKNQALFSALTKYPGHIKVFMHKNSEELEWVVNLQKAIPEGLFYFVPLQVYLPPVLIVGGRHVFWHGLWPTSNCTTYLGTHIEEQSVAVAFATYLDQIALGVTDETQ